MPLRTKLLAGATILVALFTVSSPATATGGGPVAGVTVAGASPTSPVSVSGTYYLGTATYAAYTAGCFSGSVDGTVGPAAQFVFTSLSIVCGTPLGIDTVITLASGCSITASATGTVHDGLVDDGTTGAKYQPVSFASATVGTNCVVVTMDGGCSYRVDGTLTVRFRETVTTVSGVPYQELVLSGSGLQTRGANFFCFGLIPNGSVITLNDVTFIVRPTGTPHRPIDFVPAP